MKPLDRNFKDGSPILNAPVPVWRQSAGAELLRELIQGEVKPPELKVALDEDCPFDEIPQVSTSKDLKIPVPVPQKPNKGSQDGKHNAIDPTHPKTWPVILERLVHRLEYRKNHQLAALFRSATSLIVTKDEFAFFFTREQRAAVDKLKADHNLMSRLKSTIQANTTINNAKIIFVFNNR